MLRRHVGPAAAALLCVVLLARGAPAAEPDAPTVAPSVALPAAPAPAPTAATCRRAESFRTILDVGHTAEVPGALSARGATEYDFNLRLAKLIEKDLIAAGFGQTVLMVTATAPTAGLFERVARANGLKADLFLAIHHDAVPESFLESWQFEGQEQHFSDRFPGHSIFVSNQNADPKGSLAFGRLLGNALEARGLHYTPHYTEKFMGNRRRELVDAKAGVYRYDQLIVLRHTRMPAVLLEAGSIVNRTEELLLATPEHQALISAAVVEAVDAFCATRSKPGRPPTAAAKKHG
jgi:N-acetylmuramoyl-L-alanine amidase